MVVSVAAVFIGLVVVYAGWKDLSVWALLRGDDQTRKQKQADTTTSTKAATNG